MQAPTILICKGFEAAKPLKQGTRVSAPLLAFCTRSLIFPESGGSGDFIELSAAKGSGAWMAEVEGIDMFIVFADVIGEGSDGGARSDLGSMVNSPFTTSPSVYIGSRPSSAPTLAIPRSSTAPTPLSRSARTSGRSAQEVCNTSPRIYWAHRTNTIYFSLFSDRETQAADFVKPMLPEVHNPKGTTNLRFLPNCPHHKEFSGENL